MQLWRVKFSKLQIKVLRLANFVMFISYLGIRMIQDNSQRVELRPILSKTLEAMRKEKYIYDLRYRFYVKTQLVSL